MTETCALCTGAEATTRIEAPHPLTNFVEPRLDSGSVSPEQVVIPLCSDCRTTIQKSLDRYDFDRCGGEEAARADFQDFACTLKTEIVEAASK